MDKPGRNDPCPCGSGKKYKKCCLVDEEKNYDVLRAIGKAKNEAEAIRILHKSPQVYNIKVSVVSKMGISYTDKKPVFRVIEIEERQNLYNLHLIIQDAFGWDNDHMYSFYMSGIRWDWDSEYSGDPLGGHSNYGTGKAAYKAQIRDVIDRVGQKFMYVFDYGDEIIHEMEVLEVGDLREDRAKYPRITMSSGKAPGQYDYT